VQRNVDFVSKGVLSYGIPGGPSVDGHGDAGGCVNGPARVSLAASWCVAGQTSVRNDPSANDKIEGGGTMEQIEVTWQAELTRLREEHQRLQARLTELDCHLYLSANEQVERKRIQKLKLKKKDEMVKLQTRAGLH
jgi:uncharacterized protein YdcH (DUF465 family)